MDALPESNDWQEINYPGLGIQIRARLNVESAELENNIRLNCQKGLPQVWPHAVQETPVCIVAGGPSLLDTLDEIREEQKNGAKVIALANTAKLLIKHRIRPNAHVFLDARFGNRSFIVPELDCTYFVASQCDPYIVDQLEGKRIYLWHAMNSQKEREIIEEFYEQWVPIQGGNTIALRAIRLFQVLGYKTFHLFGMDSCNKDGEHHAYEQPAADDMDTKVIALNGRSFTVTAWQIQQAMEFMQMTNTLWQNIDIQAHGDGLIQHMIKEGSKNGSNSV